MTTESFILATLDSFGTEPPSREGKYTRNSLFCPNHPIPSAARSGGRTSKFLKPRVALKTDCSRQNDNKYSDHITLYCHGWQSHKPSLQYHQFRKFQVFRMRKQTHELVLRGCGISVCPFIGNFERHSPAPIRP